MVLDDMDSEYGLMSCFFVAMGPMWWYWLEYVGEVIDLLPLPSDSLRTVQAAPLVASPVQSAPNRMIVRAIITLVIRD